MNILILGFLSVCSQVLLDSLDRIPNQHGRTKIGFIGFDSHIHFFSFNTEASSLVMSDVLDEQCLPYTDKILVNLSDSKAAIVNFLQKLPELYKNTQKTQTCLCAALDSANRILAPHGGKIVGLISSLGSFPPGNERALKNREDPKLRGNSKEIPSMASASNFYKLLATEGPKNQVCFDFFLAPPGASPDNPLSILSSYLDVSTLSNCTRFTGGRLQYYPGFNTSLNGELAIKFSADLVNFLSGDVGLEAVIRIRATQGITFNEFYGSLFMRSSDLLALPNVNLDNSYVAVGTIDEALPVPFALIQTALLFTSSFGERKIRVINAAIPITDNLREIYEGMDACVVADLYAKIASEKLLKGGGKYEEIRDGITRNIIDMMVGFKQAIGTGNNPQLQVPDSMKPLALLTCGLIKSPILTPEPLPIDYRAAKCVEVLCNSVDDNTHLFAPYFTAIGEWLEGRDNPETALLPGPLPLSSEHLDRSGIFLLDDGVSLYLLIGSNVNPAVVNECFGDFDRLGYQIGVPPNRKNPRNERLLTLIRRLSAMHHNHPLVISIIDAAKERFLFTSRLIEDKGPMDLPSYTNHVLSIRDRSNPTS
jgi:protein transport protein SEC24